MLRYSLLSIIVLCTTSTLFSDGGIKKDVYSSQNRVGCQESDDSLQEFMFHAPGDSDDISLMEIFTIRERHDHLASAPPVMVYVPPSSLDLGDRAIQIRGFYIDQFEVSNAEYERFIKATG
ncbi:MAG: hypothetical protein K940chlam3_01012, partial [Chlamydiae bacterium]|nr:hypothetical protein [Chlamydiota bacterium]